MVVRAERTAAVADAVGGAAAVEYAAAQSYCVEPSAAAAAAAAAAAEVAAGTVYSAVVAVGCGSTGLNWMVAVHQTQAAGAVERAVPGTDSTEAVVVEGTCTVH